MNVTTFFKISYGLYIVSSGNKEKGNGFISNTVFQVTSEPHDLQFAAIKIIIPVNLLINIKFSLFQFSRRRLPVKLSANLVTKVVEKLIK